MSIAIVPALVAPSVRAQGDRPQNNLPVDETIVVTDDGNVELHVVDAPLSTVLRMLSIQGRQNIIATPSVGGVVTADLYNVSFEDALQAVLLTNDCDFIVRDNFIYVYTVDEISAIQTGENPVITRILRLNYIKAVDAMAIIQPLLSAQGKVTASPVSEEGIKSDATAAGGQNLAGNDFLVVFDYPDNVSKIAKVIAQIDVMPQQVLVEATILRARLTDDNALGIDFNLLAGVDLDLLGAVSTGVQNLTLGQVPEERLKQFNLNATTAFAQNVPDGGLTFGIIQDHVAVFIRALEQITDTSVLANPKLLTLNKQVGNIIVGRRDGYITTTVTETQAVQKVEFLETGTKLTFRPFIGTDGYVRMELHPEDSVGGLTAAQLPFEQTTEVTTNVIVKDGHTILIGGLFREVSTESRSQLPFLGDLVGIGDLFRSRSDGLDREEVIILLTVHIIKNHAQFAKYSSEQYQNIERSRVGLRRGMMWHGRERLAQAHYRQALDYLTDGEPKRALRNLRMALHNHPRFFAAIELKEEIEQVRDWDEDATISRLFVQDVIMRELGINTHLFDRPGYTPMPVGESGGAGGEPDDPKGIHDD